MERWVVWVRSITLSGHGLGMYGACGGVVGRVGFGCRCEMRRVGKEIEIRESGRVESKVVAGPC
jgi:hypothetical protein